MPWCRSRGIDPYLYDTVVATNFLVDYQKQAEQKQADKGSRKNHSMFKQAWAAIAAMLSLLFPNRPPISDFTHVKGFAQTLRVTAPNLPRYSETISLDPFFLRLVEAANAVVELVGMPFKTLRDWTLLLLRIRLCCRSADLACINMIWSDDSVDAAISGLQGVSPSQSWASAAAGPPSVAKVQYDFPKSWWSRVRMSDWKDLGPYLREQPRFLPRILALLCAFYD